MSGRGRLQAAALLAAAVALFVLTPPLPQWPAYHDFADRRAWLGVPNFLDVASNALFALAGLAGLLALARAYGPGAARHAPERLPYLLFFAAAVLLAPASGCYHLAPDNAGLAWDRAAMALLFSAYLGALAAERFAGGTRLLP